MHLTSCIQKWTLVINPEPSTHPNAHQTLEKWLGVQVELCQMNFQQNMCGTCNAIQLTSLVKHSQSQASPKHPAAALHSYNQCISWAAAWSGVIRCGTWQMHAAPPAFPSGNGLGFNLGFFLLLAVLLFFVLRGKCSTLWTLKCRFRGRHSTLRSLKCRFRGRCSTLWTLKCKFCGRCSTLCTLKCRLRGTRSTLWTLNCKFCAEALVLASFLPSFLPSFFPSHG